MRPVPKPIKGHGYCFGSESGSPYPPLLRNRALPRRWLRPPSEARPVLPHASGSPRPVRDDRSPSPPRTAHAHRGVRRRKARGSPDCSEGWLGDGASRRPVRRDRGRRPSLSLVPKDRALDRWSPYPRLLGGRPLGWRQGEQPSGQPCPSVHHMQCGAGDTGRSADRPTGST